MTAQTLERRRRVAAGLCRQCGAERDGASRTYCARCKALNLAYGRRSWRRLHGPRPIRGLDTGASCGR